MSPCFQYPAADPEVGRIADMVSVEPDTVRSNLMAPDCG
jgi:hypothetical protein